MSGGTTYSQPALSPVLRARISSVTLLVGFPSRGRRRARPGCGGGGPYICTCCVGNVSGVSGHL